jgi:hypothetical protein
VAPQDIKDQLESVGKFREEAERDYLQHINRYTLSLLVAELTVVGFLLQRPDSAVLLNNNGAKPFLLISLYLCFISLLLSILDKRLMAHFARDLHFSWQARARSKESNITVAVDGIELPPDENSQKKTTDNLKSAYTSASLAGRCRVWSEYLLGAAALFAVVLVTVLVSNLK